MDRKRDAEPPADDPAYSHRGRGGAPIRLYRGEALAGMARTLAAGSVDVAVTSPPYNIGVRYSSYLDARPPAEYLAWMGEVGAAIRGVLAPEGSLFLNVGATPRDPTHPWQVAEAVRPHLVLQNVIHWVKSIAIDRSSVGRDHRLTRDLVVGHYKPLRSTRFLHGAHEYIFHFTRTGSVPLDRLAVGVDYEDRSNTRRWPGGRTGRRCRGNTWFLPYTTIRSRGAERPHPASFPPELAERCFRLHGVSRIHLALDPFVGIGSSAVAAARLGVPFVGYDLDAGYLAEADARLRREAAGRVPPDPPATPLRRRRDTALTRRRTLPKSGEPR